MDKVYLIIHGDTCKLLSCNSSGKTVWWTTEEEANDYFNAFVATGSIVEFYPDGEAEDNLIHFPLVRTVSKYG
jgi:hypothetical protein